VFHLSAFSFPPSIQFQLSACQLVSVSAFLSAPHALCVSSSIQFHLSPFTFPRPTAAAAPDRPLFPSFPWIPSSLSPSGCNRRRSSTWARSRCASSLIALADAFEVLGLLAGGSFRDSAVPPRSPRLRVTPLPLSVSSSIQFQLSTLSARRIGALLGNNPSAAADSYTARLGGGIHSRRSGRLPAGTIPKRKIPGGWGTASPKASLRKQNKYVGQWALALQANRRFTRNHKYFGWIGIDKKLLFLTVACTKRSAGKCALSC
jgi:hypothetical protein